jgi:triosephosphate isomerase
MRVKIAAGNWKMNTDAASGTALAAGLVAAVGSLERPQVILFPPFPYLPTHAATLAGSRIQLGAQNCHCEKKGAFTGEVSPEMVRDVGCQWVLIGHSERRHLFGETDDFLKKKVGAAQAAGLRVIFCVGEKLEQRQAGQTQAVVESQLRNGILDLPPEQWANVVIAYEPVWAIGTGVNATPEQAEEVHGFIRDWLARQVSDATAAATRILYGGSVTAANVASLLAQPNVDGVLVGGASLKLDDFTTIVRAAA